MTKDATAPAEESEIDRLRREVSELRHAALISRDQIIGSDAEVGRVNRDLSRAAIEVRLLTRKLRRVTQRRDELQTKLTRSRTRQEEQVARLRSRITQLEGELAQARTSLPRRAARAVRRRLR